MPNPTRYPVFPASRLLKTDWAEFAVTPSSRILSGGLTVADGDCLVRSASAGAVVTDYTVSITEVRGGASAPVITHDNAVVAAHDGHGRFTYQQDGQDNVTVASSARTAVFPLFFRASGSSPATLIGGVTGSARKSATDAIDARIAGKNPSTTKLLLSSSVGGVSYARNPSCWAADLDLTCVPVWNSWFGNAWTAGVPLSPVHVLYAKHFVPNIGTRHHYLTAGNVVVERTLKAVSGPAKAGSLDGEDYPDFAVGVLDAALPGTIKTVPILPPNWATYFPVTGQGPGGFRLPVTWIDQDLNALVGELLPGGLRSLTTDGLSYVQAGKPQDAERALWYEDVILHDSGQPTLCWIDGQPVLLQLTTSYGPRGTFLADHAATINAAMDAAWAAWFGGSNPHHVQTADLSGFNAY